MKDGVYLVNTSRGALIDTQALIEALAAKKFGGVGLDVYEEEEGLFYEDFSGEIIQDENLARQCAGHFSYGIFYRGGHAGHRLRNVGKRQSACAGASAG